MHKLLCGLDFFLALNFNDASGLHNTVINTHTGYSARLPGWLVEWMEPTVIVLIVVSEVYPQATILTEQYEGGPRL